MVKEHYTFIKEQKQQYYLRRGYAVNEPQNYLSLNIDCCAPFCFPYSHPNPKKWQHLTKKMPIHLCAVINHSISRNFIYYWPKDVYAKDSNLIISILWDHLSYYYKTYDHRPTVLYLQANNCAGKNKNHNMLSFLS